MGRPKKGTNGAGADRFAGAIAASSARDRPKPVQTSLLAGDDVITEHEFHDVEVPISTDEAELLNARAAEETAKAIAIEEEVAKLKADLIKPKEAEAKEHRKNADTAAKEAKEHKRTLNMRLRVEYHPSRATVSYFDPETNKRVKLDRAMTPKEVEYYANGAGSEVHDAPDEDAPTADVEAADA